MKYEPYVRAYEQHGFAVIPGLFSTTELREIELHLDEVLQSSLVAAPMGDVIREDDSTRSLRCLFGIERRSEYFATLMRDARLIGLVQQLFNDTDVVADGVMLIDKAPFATYEFPWHQDNAYQFWHPSDGVAVTLALDQCSADSGGIECLAGSHRLEVQPHRPSGVLGASRGLVHAPDTVRFPPVVMALEPGDVSLHHVNTIHRTGPNRTPHHRRNLGLAYHSSQSVRDDAAAAAYERDLATFLRSSGVGGN